MATRSCRRRRFTRAFSLRRLKTAHALTHPGATLARGKASTADVQHAVTQLATRIPTPEHIGPIQNRVVLRALHQSNSSGFRVVHHSVQANHLHLLVEAENKRALSSGMRGLVIRIARRVKQLLFRRGRFWADRWHGTVLTSPRQVRHALVYVLKNRHKHAANKPNDLDALSSIQWFDGLAIAAPPSFHSLGPPCAPATTWLLRIGWKRHGLLKPGEVPKSNH